MPRELDKSIKLTTMKTFKDAAIAGRTIWISVKVPSGLHNKARAMKRSVTREQVRENNDRLAVRNLMLLLNNNFDGTGAHYTLTYEDKPTIEQAAKDRENFLRRMKRAVPGIKYIAVTEYTNVRIHHHIVMSTSDVDLVKKIWGRGIVKPALLSDSGDYTKLAEYLVKDTNKTFRSEDGVHKHRWSSSRNLKKPAIRRAEVSVRELEDDPKPLKGFYIPAERIRRYTHPVTGIEYLEYLMIAIDEPRKVRLRGRRISGREHYEVNSENEQEDLFAQLGM